eukprot:gnl/MRDRNA2_/MRDRNA2_35872_c0_seq1.p1 gnl/MRDRNA2_/MRDRNA2_35872_c0~~gnl/MRDRNA2_/MRDRNA2_35872_c0_seq1.p1  ORF type:complete len:947 (-),score=142.70 gnl/MRDRNA2_/MRDRNA2_35872_c0_seq1:61-2604(-)
MTTNVCELIAASMQIPGWDTTGYLHIDRIIVQHISGDSDDPWIQQQVWAEDNLDLLRFRNVRISNLLPASGYLRITAPQGFSFKVVTASIVSTNASNSTVNHTSSNNSFDVNTLRTYGLPDLDVDRCTVSVVNTDQVVRQALSLSFTSLLLADQQFDMDLAMKGPEAQEQQLFGDVGNTWYLETFANPEALRPLDVQYDVGSWDRMYSFGFTLMAAQTVSSPGAVFDLAVFFRTADIGLVKSSMPNSLRVDAPLSFEFTACDGGAYDNMQLAKIPAAPDLQDPRIAPPMLRALPAFSACFASGNSMTISLGGRRRGSGQGELLPRTTYAFAWHARAIVGRTIPFRPRAVPGALGEAISDLFLSNELATPENMRSGRERWALVVGKGFRPLLATQLEVVFEARELVYDATSGHGGGGDAEGGFADPSTSLLRLEVRDLTPVWLIPAAPYHGRDALIVVVFSIGNQAYPSNSQIRLTLRSLDADANPSASFSACEIQNALHRRQGWNEPVKYLSQEDSYWANREDNFIPESSLPVNSEMQLTQFEDCFLGKVVGNVTGFLEKSSYVMTLVLKSLLMPPANQYALPVVVRHAPQGEVNTSSLPDLLTIEIVDGGRGQVLARSGDLLMYAVASKMSLQRWAFHTSTASAMNELTIWFQPATAIPFVAEAPEVLGFVFVAPAPFRFVQESCNNLNLQQMRTLVDQVQNVNTTTEEFFTRSPSCEIIMSPWLSDSYFQHQLVVYMPPLVDISSEITYRLQVPILNPPMPTQNPLFKFAGTGSISPKYSTSPYLMSLVNSWRLFTFVWSGGDAGGGLAPFLGVASAEALGRVGGIRKVDEVAWDGFDVVSNEEF